MSVNEALSRTIDGFGATPKDRVQKTSIWFGESTITKIAIVIFSGLLVLPFVARRAWVLHQAKMVLEGKHETLDTNAKTPEEREALFSHIYRDGELGKNKVCLERLKKAQGIVSSSWTTKALVPLLGLDIAKLQINSYKDNKKPDEQSKLLTEIHTFLEDIEGEEANQVKAIASILDATKTVNPLEKENRFKIARQFLQKANIHQGELYNLVETALENLEPAVQH